MLQLDIHIIDPQRINTTVEMDCGPLSTRLKTSEFYVEVTLGDFLSHFNVQGELHWLMTTLTLSGVGKGKVTMYSLGEKHNKKPDNAAHCKIV